MKKNLRAGLHWCLVFALLLSSHLPFVSYGNSAYFIAINDSIMPLRSFSAPIWVDGFFYVPYTVFDAATTGQSLGTSSTYQKTTSLVTVYTDTSTLIFDLEGGYCVNGVTQSMFQFRGVIENGIPYLPMTIVCNFFRISFSYHVTDYGNLVRLEKGNTNLNHARFLLENQQVIEEMYENFYYPTPEVTEEILVEEEAEEEEEEPLVDTPFCLGFVLGEEILDFSDLLDSRKVHGVFFFTETQLVEQGPYVRKLIAQGQTIGFRLMEDDLDLAKAEIDRCQGYLRQQTYTSSEIILSHSGIATALRQEGYVLWQGGEGENPTNIETMVEDLTQGEGMEYLTLFQSETTQRNWSQLMNLLGEAQFIPQIPLETIL